MDQGTFERWQSDLARARAAGDREEFNRLLHAPFCEPGCDCQP